ncbi:MAG: trypsin-like peptidase domain-containing protein [Candidatus Bathyarchaeia archaeon]
MKVFTPTTIKVKNQMEKAPTPLIDKKFVATLILVCLALGGSFAFIYLDLKRNFETLKRDYDDLKNNYENLQGLLRQAQQLQQLISLIESEYYDRIVNLTAVQIYNLTKHSVVLITCTFADGSDKVQGSGFIYNQNGYIITNSHVVTKVISDEIQNATTINVTFYNGTTVPAQLVGCDIYSDLAVIKVDWLPEQARPLLIGNSTTLMVGEPVYAIGNPFGLRGSMTAGIVSQLGRVIPLSEFDIPEPWGKYALADIIQFDAAVNPGNSGGPLLNGIGMVVGVTFAIETAGETPAFIGIGYAIPSVILERVVQAIIENGTYKHPYMGVAYDGNYIGGMLITYIKPNGPADKAGLMEEDVIVGVIEETGNLTITCADDLIIYLERYKSPGDTVSLIVKRDNTEHLIDLILGERES